jgi:hypothetical protein
VRHPENRDLAHGGVLVEDLFDLARVHVVAAADDQILLAINDEVPVLVDLADVTGLEPPGAVDRLRRRLRAVQ